MAVSRNHSIAPPRCRRCRTCGCQAAKDKIVQSIKGAHTPTREEMATLSQAAADKAVERESERLSDEIQKRLDDANFAEAIQYIQTMPEAQRELAVKIEMENKCRSSVLRQFGVNTESKE